MAATATIPGNQSVYRGLRNSNWCKQGIVNYKAFMFRRAMMFSPDLASLCDFMHHHLGYGTPFAVKSDENETTWRHVAHGSIAVYNAEKVALNVVERHYCRGFVRHGHLTKVYQLREYYTVGKREVNDFRGIAQFIRASGIFQASNSLMPQT